MGGTALVWFRRDLRVHDHPPLAAALAGHERVVPVFCLDRRLLRGRFPSGARAWFLLESLRELDEALRARGAGLAVRHGAPHDTLPALARETGARAVYLASDVSPFAVARDRAVRAALDAAGVRAVHTPGNFAADVNRPRTPTGKPHQVFSPFWRAWRELPRREVHAAPETIPGVEMASDGIPALEDLGLESPLTEPCAPGERAGRARMEAFLAGPVDAYKEHQSRLAGGSSELSPYLHFGCVSARELEARVLAGGPSPGRGAFRRQLCWRDFYAHVLLNFPDNARREFRAKYAALAWDEDEEKLAAWKAGRTGFPLIDAGMRQLAATGWMHNRARLSAGSFLTKDLHLDWRSGEAHFMSLLLDGDEAQNNGNWQWIAGVGVDPQPWFKRIYNPATHLHRFDPRGEYVRRWVPELARVPLEHLAEPAAMSPEEQEAAGCVIGRDYPAPIVDHAAERREAAARYGAVPG